MPTEVISVVRDEDPDVRLRLHVGPGVRAETVAYRGLRHLTNGALVRAMAAAGDVDVFVTADTNLRYYQQPVADLPFGVLVLRPRRAVLARLLELMPEVRRRLPAVRPGTVEDVHHPPECTRAERVGGAQSRRADDAAPVESRRAGQLGVGGDARGGRG